MPVYLALLRGINVSGKKIIKMEDLRRLMTDAGYLNVKTYIQSGNVIFEGSQSSGKEIGLAIEAVIERHYGFEVSVFVLQKEALESAVDNNPYAEGREEEPAGFKKLYVTFLSDTPSQENFEKLLQAPIGKDLIDLEADILYFRLESKASDSKLSNNLTESKLKVRATTRNWNTTLKLLSMME
ncbi:DUF1697 domain-containing protein [Flavobacterium sp. DG1-102-2]|uniref:DUF1697 domain-containing protein n=1 Tax=Flavobacterium sp. DG1-102-2 TaxID=3081663 RepID=UPI00294A4404|nr:DUF1697 domain-containing protein [Flavobacterium sp. DG1-102-2]MDV6166988.1 DUF1697 domain-containing protein [Flavobacterium sp. DG1-102-2]